LKLSCTALTEQTWRVTSQPYGADIIRANAKQTTHTLTHSLTHSLKTTQSSSCEWACKKYQIIMDVTNGINICKIRTNHADNVTDCRLNMMRSCFDGNLQSTVIMFNWMLYPLIIFNCGVNFAHTYIYIYIFIIFFVTLYCCCFLIYEFLSE